MEQLTKQQIVLVTLLVSFVTSIATGIVTVALMDQAPPGVTQTINRVVERTIEKVIPAPAQQQASVVTKETVVVKEDDLVVAAVDKNAKSLVSIFATETGGDASSKKFVGNGLVIGKDGLLVTDATIAVSLDDAGNPITETFTAVLPDGTTVPLSGLSAANGPDTSLAFFKPKPEDLPAQAGKTEKTKAPTFSPASLADASALKLGQTVIALGGEKISVDTGIVANLFPASKTVSSDTATSTDSTAKVAPQVITTDIHTVGKNLGSILVNLSGEVVGIRVTAAGESDNKFSPASTIASYLVKVTTASATAKQ